MNPSSEGMYEPRALAAPGVRPSEPESRGYAFTRGLDYESIVAASERVTWTVDEIFRDRRFDGSRPMVPASRVGTETLGFLDDHEQIVLNRCRAFSYVHLLGNFEEFAPPHIGGLVQADWHADRAQLRALLRFGEEEMKHQQLFARAERVLEESCDHEFGRHFDPEKIEVTALTAAVLEHSPLSRSLMVLALEWGTQRHFVESIRDGAGARGDALYADLLRAHWVEEAQHVKSDAMEIARMASAMSEHDIESAFADIASLGALVDGAFANQAEKEIETLERVTGVALPAIDRETLHDTLHQSLSRIFAGVGLTHPRFAQVALELSRKGAATLGLS